MSAFKKMHRLWNMVCVCVYSIPFSLSPFSLSPPPFSLSLPLPLLSPSFLTLSLLSRFLSFLLSPSLSLFFWKGGGVRWLQKNIGQVMEFISVLLSLIYSLSLLLFLSPLSFSLFLGGRWGGKMASKK